MRGRHNANGGPAALSLPLSSHEVSLHPALDLSREEGRMWTHLSLRTHVNETTKSLPNLPLHTGSLLGTSLVAEIAPGMSGGEGGVKE